MFYLFDDYYLYIDGDFNACFTAESTEGYYQQYLAWVAEGNTAEEWNPNGNQ